MSQFIRSEGTNISRNSRSILVLEKCFFSSLLSVLFSRRNELSSDNFSKNLKILEIFVLSHNALSLGLFFVVFWVLRVLGSTRLLQDIIDSFQSVLKCFQNVSEELLEQFKVLRVSPLESREYFQRVLLDVFSQCFKIISRVF